MAKGAEKRGSGCGSAGRAVASNSRGPRFESSFRQTFTVNCIEKTKIKKNRPGMTHLEQIMHLNIVSRLAFIHSQQKIVKNFFLNGPTLFVYFRSFQTNLIFFYKK